MLSADSRGTDPVGLCRHLCIYCVITKGQRNLLMVNSCSGERKKNSLKRWNNQFRSIWLVVLRSRDVSGWVKLSRFQSFIAVVVVRSHIEADRHQLGSLYRYYCHDRLIGRHITRAQLLYSFSKQKKIIIIYLKIYLKIWKTLSNLRIFDQISEK